MGAPMQRRFLGEYLIRYQGEVRKVCVYVNAQEIAEQCAKAAFESKSKRIKRIFGAVLVEDTTR